MKLLLEDDVFIIAIKNTLILAVVTGPVLFTGVRIRMVN